MIYTDKHIVTFDVDDTLIMWNPGDPDDPRCIKVERKVQFQSDFGPIEYKTITDYLLPHIKHIEQLKIHKTRGHFNIVWSAGGAEWANKAVDLLGIRDWVDFVGAKPSWSYDDKKPEEYMPKSQWIKDE